MERKWRNSFPTGKIREKNLTVKSKHSGEKLKVQVDKTSTFVAFHHVLTTSGEYVLSSRRALQRDKGDVS